MKLSAKGRYAVTAMVEMALCKDGARMALADIAQRQNISLSYLEQLVAPLRRRGLVNGMRGPGGGYCLGRPAGNISVAEVIDAVDDGAEPAAGAHGERCLTHELWRDLSQEIHDFLDGMTLAELVPSERGALRH